MHELVPRQLKLQEKKQRSSGEVKRRGGRRRELPQDLLKYQKIVRPERDLAVGKRNYRERE